MRSTCSTASPNASRPEPEGATTRDDTVAEKTIHFISLGCPKNRVDSEVMLGVAQHAGYTHIDDASAAEVIVVNTCGFIDPAKEESIATILEMADHKKRGSCQRLVVAGCLSQRHPDEMSAELPEVDHFLGSSDMLRLADVLRGGAERILVGQPQDWVINAADPRALSTNVGSAYVKIAEGCNRKCSFCVIPLLRGLQRSRPIHDVVREVEQLVSRGVREVNLVSQDTIAYGRDRDDGATLPALVEKIADVAGVHWVRLFYLYPEKIDDALIALLADHPRVLPYVDMPLQHAADGMLRRMRRGHGGPRLRQVVERLRHAIDDVTFRTAFIVGHPGETDAEFAELCDFVSWAKPDRVGVFRYSDEESCHANTLDGKVPEDVADARWRELMALAREISNEKNRALIGRELEVLVEGQSDEHELVMMGRHRGQAPEIDGQVYLSGTEMLDTPPSAGQIARVKISQSSDYDLVGEVVALDAERAPSPKRTTLRVLPSDNRALR
jgi:ribosomal protein S12 methylthiotransferase